MRLKDFHATQIDLSEMEDQDMRPKRDHRSGKKDKSNRSVSKEYKRKIAELRDEDACDQDY